MATQKQTPYRYFVWEGRKLFRTTDDGTDQGRWDASKEEWVDSGSFAYDKAFVSVDPYFLEVDKETAIQAYPEALGEEADALLADFEQKAGASPEGDPAAGPAEEGPDEEVALSAADRDGFDALVMMAREMLRASKGL